MVTKCGLCGFFDRTIHIGSSDAALNDPHYTPIQRMMG
jgi:hypothetical protein